MKARCGMLGLNDCVWREDDARKCSLCNLGVIEDVWHFMCVCPMLSDIRVRVFGERYVNMERCVDILNGENWDGLYEYICIAGRIRRELVREFNF